ALMSTSLTKVSISILEVEGFPQIFRRSSQQTTSVTSGKKPVKDFMDVSSKESTRYQLLWAIWTWAKENRKSWTPQKPPLVRKAFELYATGRYNLEGLIEEMYRLGLRNRKGSKVTPNGFSVMLNTPFYFGLIRVKRTNEMFPGSHEPLIPKSIFDRVQGILNGKTNTRVQKHDFLFRRLLRCKHCGYSLIAEIHNAYT